MPGLVLRLAMAVGDNLLDAVIQGKPLDQRATTIILQSGTMALPLIHSAFSRDT